MRTKLDDKILAQLQQLKHMDSVVGLLQSELDVMKEDLISVSGDTLLRTQGYAKALKDILQAIQSSTEAAKRYKKA